jgi:hypothetical protein
MRQFLSYESTAGEIDRGLAGQALTVSSGAVDKQVWLKQAGTT